MRKFSKNLGFPQKPQKMKSTKIHHFTLKFTSFSVSHLTLMSPQKSMRILFLWIHCWINRCSFSSSNLSMGLPQFIWLLLFFQHSVHLQKETWEKGIPECFEMGWSSEMLQRETTSPCGNHRTLSPITSYAAMCDSVLLVRIISTNLGIEI